MSEIDNIRRAGIREAFGGILVSRGHLLRICCVCRIGTHAFRGRCQGACLLGVAYPYMYRL